MRASIVLLLVFCSCDAPKDALVQSCRKEALTPGGRCTLSAGAIRSRQSAYVDANTKNEKVRVEAAFSVAKGRVAVTVTGCDEVTVTPEQPATLTCDAALNRRNYTFHVETAPRGGSAEGFAGTLSFTPL